MEPKEKFSDYFLSKVNPEFAGYYIDYATLKSRIHQLPTYCHSSAERCIAELRIKADAFGQLFDFNINRTAMFYAEKVQEYVTRLQNVRHRWVYLSKETLPQIYEELKAIAEGIRKCIEFLEFNSEAVHRILKKTEKHVLKCPVQNDLGKAVYKMVSSDYFIRNRLRPDRVVASRLNTLRIHLGVDRVVEEIRKRCDAIRSLEGYWLERKIITPEYVRNVHKRRNTLQILRDLHSSVQSTVQKTKWYYGCLAQAKIDYENEPIGEASPSGIILNHYNTFLYLANCYSVIPTANLFAAAVSLPPMVSGILIAMTSLFAMLAALIFSIWSNRSFKYPLVFSSFLLIGGNFSYAVALDYKSAFLMFLGRLLIGLGGCRVINRRYIADFVSVDWRTFHSALFVAMSSLGMSLGPGAQYFFNMFNFKLPYFGYTVNHLTAASWICGLLWSLYLIQVMIYFREPYRREARSFDDEFGLLAPLLSESSESQVGEPRLSNHHLDMVLQNDHRAASTTDMNGVFTCLWIYFILKLTQEAFQTASPLFTAYEFSWSEADIGYFLAFIGIVVFPVNLLIGCVGSYISDRTMTAITLILLGLGAVFSTNWVTSIRMNLSQFYVGAFTLVIAAQCLESVSMSLLSKIMPKSLSIGFWNSGFLSTEAGAFGRVVGASLITIVGSVAELMGTLSIPELQIWVLLPCIILINLTLLFVYWNWESLSPLNDRMLKNIATDADKILSSSTWEELPELQPLAVQLQSTELSNTSKVSKATAKY